jgi:hypothetical protein
MLQSGWLGSLGIVLNARRMVLTLAIGVLAGGAFADTKPNVILVMADDMGWAQTSYYNHRS